MPKYYVESGRVVLVLEARHAREAAVKAFQWTCDRQATIQAACPLEHVRVAERLGWQLHETIHVSERGFGQPDAEIFDTLDVVVAWQERRVAPLSAGGVVHAKVQRPRDAAVLSDGDEAD